VLVVVCGGVGRVGYGCGVCVWGFGWGPRDLLECGVWGMRDCMCRCCFWLMGVLVGGGMVVLCVKMGSCRVTSSCEGVWVGEEGGVNWGSLVGSV